MRCAGSFLVTLRDSLVATSEGSPLSLQLSGASCLAVVVGPHLYLPQSDSSLGTISGHILLHCGLWLLSSIGGILLLSCGIGLGAPLKFQLSLLLCCDGGSKGKSSFLLTLGFPHKF